MTFADQIIHNAVILTMDARNSEASAMALAGDRILGVGSREELQRFVGPQTRQRDMAGQTIMPGFCDAHGHILLTADMLDWENLNSPPIGVCRSLDDCLARLRERAERTPEGEWVLAYGFDDTLMAEKRFPTREELDAISCGHPVFVQHISIHPGVLNSAGFAALGIDEHTPDPEGGIIRHHADGSLHGVVEERALFDLVSPRLPVFSRDHKVQNVARVSREVYAARGITTALDAGVLDYDGAEVLQETDDRGLLAVRVHYNPYYYLDGDDPRLQSRGKVKRGGVKIMSDGSIQGFTAYLSRPYHTPFRGDADYRGYPAYPCEELFAIIEAAHRKGQFLIHTNGDGAVDDALDALEAAQAKYPRTDCRHTLVHAQTIRDDQLDRLAGAGFTPTFFVPHVYYWGDRHRDIFLGPERAARMDPIRSAMDRGHVCTSHCDTPITPVLPFLSIWVCVNRLTSGGSLLGVEERIPVLEALRAHTINAAWQHFEEDEKGSLEPGKLADFIVLDANPLTCPPEALKDIQVLETVLGGETIYQHGQA
ncbi:amidohydrolase [uncultured Desulfovibrio sp.]|uniref:amidohydrolase n=1 Tax=uncultured Desulfovibrio sp. TaxID=167968 RepID=UPI002633BFC3|nr:amidohydrolase [uncultured Desulfovibrio sp.]